MNKKLKNELRAIYDAPPPVGKTAFLKKFHRRELSRKDFILCQAGYIRWWIWGVSILLFGIILWLSADHQTQDVWVGASLTPLLALLAVVENGKSRRHRMEELELACRISLRSVVLARISILGVFHLLLLGAMIPALAAWGAVGIMQTGVYLLTPYLLTAAIGMELSRHFRGNDGLLACSAVAGIVCALGLSDHRFEFGLYRAEFMHIWGITLLFALLVCAFELSKMMKETEELQWN